MKDCRETEKEMTGKIGTCHQETEGELPDSFSHKWHLSPDGKKPRKKHFKSSKDLSVNKDWERLHFPRFSGYLSIALRYLN